MTLFQLHDDFASKAGDSRVTLARTAAWFAATVKTVHQAIVAARTRRLRRELMFHADPGDETFDESFDKPLGEQDIRKMPQRPMFLGDKWDF